MTTSNKALENIRVIDMTRVLAGPFCTQMLGDMGADVIKIEKPASHNNAGGDDTRKWGPPFAKDADGNDTTESAYYLSANRNKRSLALDITTPQGQDIIHALLAKSDVLIENFKVGGLAKYGLSYIVPYQVFASSDGHIILAVGNDGQFADFCRVIGKEEWARDEKFNTNPARVANRETLIPMISEVIAAQTTSHWIKTLPQNNVPCGPVNTMDQVFQMPQIAARDMTITMHHDASQQDITLVGSPLKFSDTPVSYDRAPPSCGQDSHAVLSSVLDMSDAEIKTLRAQGTIEICNKTT